MFLFRTHIGIYNTSDTTLLISVWEIGKHTGGMFSTISPTDICLCEYSFFEPHSKKEYTIHRGRSLRFQCYTIHQEKILGLNRVLQRGEEYFILASRLEFPSEALSILSCDKKGISNVYEIINYVVENKRMIEKTLARWLQLGIYGVISYAVFHLTFLNPGIIITRVLSIAILIFIVFQLENISKCVNLQPNQPV